MRFESHVISTKYFVSHIFENMRHNDVCYYLMNHKRVAEG